MAAILPFQIVLLCYRKVGLLTVKNPPYEGMLEIMDNMRQVGQPCFSLSAEEIMKKYPALRLSPQEIGVLEPTSGMIHADAAVQALQVCFTIKLQINDTNIQKPCTEN